MCKKKKIDMLRKLELMKIIKANYNNKLKHP